MPKRTLLFIIGIAAFGSAFCSQGCSSGPADKPVVLASAEDVQKANISKAATILDQVEKRPKAQRQSVVNRPRVVDTLKAASADPDTKARITKLGITLD